MKLITIVNAHNVVDSFSEKEGISARLAYWLTKFVVATQSDADFYEDEVRKLFDKYGEKNEDDGNIKIKEENISAFSEELRELQDTDAQDPEIRFTLTELDELKVNMKQIYPLMDFIKEE